jgi:hypothetical protein
MKNLFFAMMFFICSVPIANTAVLTFDDLPNSTTFLPVDYGGFNWANTFLHNEILSPQSTVDPVASGTQCVEGWGSFGSFWTITRSSDFDFSGAYFTGAYLPLGGDILRISGYNDGILVKSDTYQINLSPTWLDVNLANVDKIEIISSDGFKMYMDDFTYNVSQVPVPEPATFLLTGTGLAGLVFLRRRIKA